MPTFFIDGGYLPDEDWYAGIALEMSAGIVLEMSIGIHLSTSQFFREGPWPIVHVRITEPNQAIDGRFAEVFDDSSHMHGELLAAISLQFPSPGSVEFGRLESQELGPPERPKPVAVWVRLQGPKIDRPTGFFSSPIGSNDSLVLFALGPTNFAGNFFHRSKELKMDTCVVSCADGKTAHPCITCTSGDVEIRICC